MSSERKELLLAAVLSKEVASLGQKMEFWGLDAPANSGTLWESQDPLTVEQVLSAVDINSLDFLESHTLQTLYCLGWEFVWGKRPPVFVSTKRRELLNKAEMGEDLSDLETVWLQTIIVDTDMF